MDRIPASFKTQVAGRHVHRHIVLLIRSKETGEFGALGRAVQVDSIKTCVESAYAFSV